MHIKIKKLTLILLKVVLVRYESLLITENCLESRETETKIKTIDLLSQ